MFVILEDRFGRLSFAPESWVLRNAENEEVVYWPKTNQTLLIRDPTSKVLTGPDKWLIVADTVKRRGLPELKTVEGTEELIEEMMGQSRTETDTETEDDRTTKKRRKIASKGEQKQMTSIPNFPVKNVTTPPSSALRSNRIASNTPTSRKQLFVTNQTGQTPPGSLLMNNPSPYVGMSPQMSQFFPTIPNDLNVLASTVSCFETIFLNDF